MSQNIISSILGSIGMMRNEMRQSATPPSQACIRMKVVYNKDFVNDAGNGNLAAAHQVAKDVVHVAQDIYSNRFSPENRLGTEFFFDLIAGNMA